MADAMRTVRYFWLSAAIGLLALFPFLANAADGEGMKDPTRPMVLDASAKPATEADADAVPAAVLQTVILRPGRKPAAMINGQMVELGGEIAGARVTAITDNQVVLTGLGGKEILKLNPSVEKRVLIEKTMAKKVGKPVVTRELKQ
ncbi:MAG: hypothetical protein EKK46_01770 [Rhodocyclaceae bacterium]|nr:MAG: hypothetical protein EKK46_01770 [Rhodocyclaceae bacterium]